MQPNKQNERNATTNLFGNIGVTSLQSVRMILEESVLLTSSRNKIGKEDLIIMNNYTINIHKG